MLFAIGLVLLIAWLFGAVGAYTSGLYVHLLLIAAIVLFVLQSLANRLRDEWTA